MKIEAIVGSNKKLSYNRKLLQFMKNHFADDEININEVKDFPMFNENYPAGEEDHDPELVTELAKRIEAADAVIIGCPEYNHSVPSALKSAIEWLSYRIHPLHGKPVMIVGASIHPQGSSRSQTHLREILDSPGVFAEVFPGNEFFLGTAKKAFDNDGELINQGTVGFLEQCFTGFKKYAEEINDFKKVK
ncbi:NADPH-dependent FMN reductase [Companilactobacillus nodensis]|uniref:Fumarate reductase, flavoprotein subunit n=1 Tax=Companilactobacillus nodensis DSM 19682 = JCM 14932 = NBRC 107160 TaxID=1423775 RepID=A0A0R1KCC3_9LACO|nr:NADPH-dependent FMN reductase [Companilactobacillus nodensis]KRK81310.1 fumarate reductase, flavoprotein subunit [Companilactobacillus nodensis DSM 19682 = JCM 14932 = NBRC 107160]